MFAFRIAPIFALVALGAIADSTPARADLPEVALGDVFKTVCAEMRDAVSCNDCECTAVTSTSPDKHTLGVDPEFAHAILVKLQSPPGDHESHHVHYRIAIGSDAALRDAGSVASLTSTTSAPVHLDVVVRKSMQFHDLCLACDHENVGLVHLFDLEMKQQSTTSDEGALFEHNQHVNALVTCFKGSNRDCFMTPLGTGEQTNVPSRAPGDKGKRGRKLEWLRTWKIGGRNRMQVVLGTIEGSRANDLKGGPIATEPRAFNFTDIPMRETTVPVQK